jgi:NAD(P)-dependent dehydrogenase (short-subunit alcohol dehydrogenase family)
VTLKTLLIGGADGFLGSEALKFFSTKGFRIIGTVLNQDSLKKTTAFISSNRLQNVTLHQVDLAQEVEVEKLFSKLQEKPLYVFNAAGGFIFAKPQDASAKDVDFLLNANFKSNWLLLKHAQTAMAQKNFGRIVFVSAAATAQKPGSGMGLYVGSKLALNALIDASSDEFSRTGIKINAVAPTIIDTPRNRADMPDADFSTWVPAEKVLQKVLDFLSDAPSITSGSIARL